MTDYDSLTHVIFTRFNLATPGHESTIRCRPGWLESRFSLFERYCLPSVAAQDCRDFRWIILFDKDTPAEFRERIERYRDTQDFYPYYTGLFPGTGWAQAVREVLGDTHESWLLTTPLDNDDSLARDFVSRLQQAVRSAGALRRGAFNMTNGAILANGRLYRCVHKSNAFASWLERYDENMVTIGTIAHMTLAMHGPVTQVGGPAAWLQVVHGENVSNKIRGHRIKADADTWPFPMPILDEIKEDSRLAIATENLTVGRLRNFRDRLLWLYHKYYGNRRYVNRSLDSIH